MKAEGTTKIVGIFGYPVRHSASPAIHNAAFRALGLNYAYFTFEVKPAGLADALKALVPLNITGINVTIPHKEAVIPYLDELSPEAETIRAVNTIVVRSGKLLGYNTDAPGFIASLKEAVREKVKGKTLLLLGAGGAARAIATQAAREGAGKIFLTDKIPGKAKAVLRCIKENFPAARGEAIPTREIPAKLQETNFLINATPVGMKPGDPLIVHPEQLPRSLLVFDLIYNRETSLISGARKRGCRVIGGREMLLQQAALSFKLWTGKNAPLPVMRKALEEKLA